MEFKKKKLRLKDAEKRKDKLQKYSIFRIIARNTISSIYGAECLNIKKIPHPL